MMKILLSSILLLLSFSASAQYSMRRCTLLPITDSVGGAIGFKVFQEVEASLKKSNWCTYVSNSSLISVFSRYRENLPQFLKTKEVLATVAEKLKVGSIVKVNIVNEVGGVDVDMMVYGENGEDIYFSEKATLNKDDIDLITTNVTNWLDMYSKMIPYDAKINGILGEQITLDVGKGFPIEEGQSFVVKRLVAKKKHPLLKKVVDWDTEVLAEGKIFNVSDNQALGQIKVYKQDKKLVVGDWVRLDERKQSVALTPSTDELEPKESVGSLGILSVAILGSTSSVDTTMDPNSSRMSGNLFGLDFRFEGWLTREYFAAVELMRSIGKLKKTSGDPVKNEANTMSGIIKLTGGYKYLPTGFFYGPQIDFYGGVANHSLDMDESKVDGFGNVSGTGLLIGAAANIPISKDFKFFASADFMPLPGAALGGVDSMSAMELEVGIKYQYNVRLTLDGGIETISRKIEPGDEVKEISYMDNMLKLGFSYNF